MAALVRLGSNRSDPLDLDLMAETGWGRLETRLLAQLWLGSARATAQVDGGLASGSGDGAAWRLGGAGGSGGRRFAPAASRGGGRPPEYTENGAPGLGSWRG